MIPMMLLAKNSRDQKSNESNQSNRKLFHPGIAAIEHCCTGIGNVEERQTRGNLRVFGALGRFLTLRNHE